MRAQEPEDKPTPLPGSDPMVALARLPRKSHSFALMPSAEELAAIAGDLSLLALRKVRLTGTLSPVAKNDWLMTAQLGATVVQPCTVTLAPVTTRIDEPVGRRYVDQWDTPEAGTETEMPDDDSAEPLPPSLDLREVLHECLSLSLPLYPRAGGVGFEDVQTAEPGVTPMTDEDVKPFAGLAALRAQLTNKDEADGD